MTKRKPKRKEIIAELRRRIVETFPNIDLKIEYDEEEDQILVMTPRDFFHDDYLELILRIRTEYLWVHCILNVLFIPMEKLNENDMRNEKRIQNEN